MLRATAGKMFLSSQMRRSPNNLLKKFSMSLVRNVINAAVVAVAAFCLTPMPSIAESLNIASWNLGWHVAAAEVPNWIAQCSKSYIKDATDGVWKPAKAGDKSGTIGWSIKESRAKVEGVDLAVMPPCGVYESANREKIPVTPVSLAKRSQQIATIIEQSVKPDVMAFQEVSGVAAVKEALGKNANQYNICSFDGEYKIQRLAFAWKKEFGEATEKCTVIHAMSLPDLPKQDQVRPGYTVTLKIRGRTSRFLTLHLKASCVSPLDRGQLDEDKGNGDPCPILQQQVAPLEEVFEKLGDKVDHFVVLGDFNRNLWHEMNEVTGAKAVRSDGSTDLSKPRAASVKTQNLFKEINDGMPSSSRASLVSMSCPGGEETQKLCERSKTEALKRTDLAPLTGKDSLGCRNPIGLDHFVVSDSLKSSVTVARKIAIGAFGRSMAASDKFPEPLLAVSDHCPIVMAVTLK
jgi:endonuclease/exonuclease/phosphatase family metal-dependent hydrolase